MKTSLIVILYLCLNLTASAQGLVIFANNPATLVSDNINGNNAAIHGPVGSYYFALLTAPSPAGPFTFTGLYATNVVSLYGGRFSGGTVAVPGWAPGATMFYDIWGWSADMGQSFNPFWLTSPPAWGRWGFSAVGSGVAGGGPQNIPPLPLFGGTGITQGFMFGPFIPEPSNMALTGLGAAVWLIFRRRMGRTNLFGVLSF
jgi:hypothetical protein